MANHLIQEHRFAHDVADAWPVCFDIIQFVHVYTLNAAGDSAHGDVCVFTIAQGHHTAAYIIPDQING